MPLPATIVGRSTEPVIHEIDAEWLAAFAASIDDRAETAVAHPLFPVCVEWAAVTAAARLDDGALLPDERRRGIHATHDLTIHRLLRAGDVLTTIATVEALAAHRRGTFEQLRLETRDAVGALVATTVMGSLFLGVAIEGAPRPSEAGATAASDRPALAKTAPVSTTEIAVAADQAMRYSEASRIWNPIHTDTAAATAAGLPAPVLHGTCTLAMATSAALASAGIADPNAVRRVQARFAGMVLMPSTLELRVMQPSAREVCFDVVDREGVAVIRGGHLTT